MGSSGSVCARSERERGAILLCFRHIFLRKSAEIQFPGDGRNCLLYEKVRKSPADIRKSKSPVKMDFGLGSDKFGTRIYL